MGWASAVFLIFQMGHVTWQGHRLIRRLDGQDLLVGLLPKQFTFKGIGINNNSIKRCYIKCRHVYRIVSAPAPVAAAAP